MSNITFTSKITPISSTNFSKMTSSFSRDNYVGFPWNISTSRVAKDVYTNHICDCNVMLLTNGDKALLMHLMPLNEKQYTYGKIFKAIENNFDIHNDELQAVIVGSQPTKASQYIFDLFTSVLNNLNIPISIFRIGKSPTHVAYRTCKDEVYISNKHIDKALIAGKSELDSLKAGFNVTQISPVDYV
jgi:hypothetical protein